MDGAGILRRNDDGSLDMNCVFGMPGTVERPKTIGPESASVTNLYFHLVRDRKVLEVELGPAVQVPAEAALAFARNRRLGAGINLNAVVDGNLHPGYERDAPLADEEIRSIAEVGFQSIRLGVCWVKHCAQDRPYTIDPAFFAKVDHIVNVALAAGLAVSIDQHYYPYINMSIPDEHISMEENYERLVMLWEQIAEHYKDYSDETLFFDILNEPNVEMGAEKWNWLFNRVIRTIRKTNPGRTLLVATPNMGQSWTLNYLELPQDDWNLIVQFHYYLPHLLTHQGLTYALAGDSAGAVWSGTEAEKEPIVKDLDFCSRWSKKNGRPLNMGEYGVVNTVEEASRARYIGFVLEEARKRDFSSHLWGYREPFMIRDEKTGAWIPSILEAMRLK
jgi:endoglucanase